MKLRRSFSSWFFCALATISATCLPQFSPAQISYTTPGANYSQDFNSLPTTPENVSIQTTIPWTDNSTSSGTQTSLPGWYLWHPIIQTEGGINSHQRIRIGAGTSNTGSFWDFGTSSTTDRALGSVGSNTMANESDTANPMVIGLRLSNNTGFTLTEFTVTYDGEQWRNGGSGTANQLTFAYGIGATTADWTNASFIAVAGLNFTAPVVSATAAAVDGNAAGKVSGITATVSGISWAPGTDLWLRWSDVNNLGADDGLAIDNVNFSATQVPEPSVFSLLGLSAAALAFLRRKQRS
jgi:hypothetical protein